MIPSHDERSQHQEHESRSNSETEVVEDESSFQMHKYLRAALEGNITMLLDAINGKLLIVLMEAESCILAHSFELLHFYRRSYVSRVPGVPEST